MSGLIFIPFILIGSLFFFILPIALGVYVYRDADKRGMNALLWTLIVVFAPSFIGLIIYVLVRENQSGYECANCHAPVKDNQDFCPNCGDSLQNRYDLNEGSYGNQKEGRVRKESSPMKMGPLLLALLLVALGIIVMIVFAGILFSRSMTYPESFMWNLFTC